LPVVVGTGESDHGGLAGRRGLDDLVDQPAAGAYLDEVARGWWMAWQERTGRERRCVPTHSLTWLGPGRNRRRLAVGDGRCWPVASAFSIDSSSSAILRADSALSRSTSRCIARGRSS